MRNHFFNMRIIPSLLLALVLTMGYLMFFRAQTESARTTVAEAPKSGHPQTSPNDPYKAAMDRAHLAADQMLSARQDADAIR